MSRYPHNHIIHSVAILPWKVETCHQEHHTQHTATACAVRMCSGNCHRTCHLPGQCSHIIFPHFIGIKWYFMVSRRIFCYIVVTLLSHTGCRYWFRVSFSVCHFDMLDWYRVLSIPGSDHVTICSPIADTYCICSIQPLHSPIYSSNPWCAQHSGTGFFFAIAAEFLETQWPI